MARSRKQQQTQQVQNSNTETQNENDNNTNTDTKEKKVAGTTIDVELIDDLLAGARQKGAGDEYLQDFLASGDKGWEVDLTTGTFQGKSAQQAQSTLLNAKKRTRTNDNGETVLVNPDAGQVQVIKRKIDGVERVFLIDKAK